MTVETACHNSYDIKITTVDINSNFTIFQQKKNYNL